MIPIRLPAIAAVTLTIAAFSTVRAAHKETYLWTTFAGNTGGFGATDGPVATAHFAFPFSIASDASDNLYIADSSSSIIRKITPEGIVSTLAGSPYQEAGTDGPGSLARFDRCSGVAAAPDGTVYVADTNNHTIRRISTAGIVSTLAGTAGQSGSVNGTGSAARFSYPFDLTVDSSGNVYVADNDNETIRKITPGGVVTTLAGSPGIKGSADGTGSAARFDGPYGVAVDAGGNVYVADTFNYTIRKITPAGVVTTIAGTADASGTADGTGSAARFRSPRGLKIDSSGNFYIAEYSGHTIRKMTPAGVVTTLAGSPDNEGFANGTGSAARFNTPSCVALDRAGNVYVTDSVNHAIRKVTPARVVTTLSGGPAVTGSANGTGAAARFNGPGGAAVDTAGNIYISDTDNNTIRKITPAAVVTTLAGSPGVRGFVNGTGNAARFGEPRGLAVDSGGNVYVADQGNHSIRKITPAGVVTTLAGNGNSGRDDGTGGAASFYSPSAVAVDGAGTVYVADTTYNTIRKITPAGAVTTWAGTSGSAGSANGTGSAARFHRPTGITVDAAGNVYVADTLNYAIRKITPSAVVTTVAGSPGSSQGSADGTGSAARFSEPDAIAVDGEGNLYVTDDANSLIRKITPARVVTTIGGLYASPLTGDGPGSVARFNGPSGIASTADGIIYIADTDNDRIVRGAIMPPVATPQSFTTPEDTPKALTLTGTDVDGDSLTFAIVTPPAHGSLTGSGAMRTYTPAANYYGPDSFTFKANDGELDSAPATVSISVTAVNDQPAAAALTVNAVEDTPSPVNLTGSDIDGDALTFAIVTPPAHGTLTGSAPGLTYTPAADYNGPDSFVFKTNDGALDSAPATVSISIAAVNDPPVFTAPLPDVDAGPAAPDAQYDLLPLLRDPDIGDSHSWRIVSNSNLSIFAAVSVDNGRLSISYAPWVSGTSSLTIEVKDAAGEIAQMTVPVTLPVLPAPEIAVSEALKLNRQTGLWEHRITLRNTAQRDIGGFEVTVSGLPAGACLYNASDCLSGDPRAGYYQPVAPGESVTMVLEYFSPHRSASLQPVLSTAVALPKNPPAGAAAGLAVDRVAALPDNALLIEFTALPGHEYIVQYSADNTLWVDSPVRIRAAGNRVQWIDRGSPRTTSPPAPGTTRFYRVRESAPTP